MKHKNERKQHRKTSVEPVEWESRACLTISEASRILSCPASQLRKLCRIGRLNPIVSMGRKWRLHTDEIKSLLAERLHKSDMSGDETAATGEVAR